MFTPRTYRSSNESVRIRGVGAPLLCATPAAAQAPVSGIGQAKDGDSLMVGGTEVRLFGIDAPEWDQHCRKNGQEWSCGSAAAEKLGDLVTSRNVVCSKRRHGRAQARAWPLHGWGHGREPRDGRIGLRGRVPPLLVGLRLPAEESAKANKRGIWAGHVPDAQRLSPCRRYAGAGAAQDGNEAQHA